MLCLASLTSALGEYPLSVSLELFIRISFLSRLRGAVKALCILFSLLENNEKPMRTHTEDEENKLRGLYDLFNELLGRDAPMTIPLAADDTRTLDAVLDCISCIEKVVRTTPPNFVVSRLCNLEPGLLPWLRDESKMLTDSQYNDVVSYRLIDARGTRFGLRVI